MQKTLDTQVIPIEIIEQKIYLIRGMKVMLDSDLASLYQVPLKSLNQQVKRNEKRFPKDFMFQLTETETEMMRSQFVTASKSKRNTRYLPYAFTEQGIAMLASVLKSERAIEASIAIIRVFVHLRELILSHKDLARRLDELEQNYDEQFRIVFEAIRQLMQPEVPKSPKPPLEPKERMGFFSKN